MTTFASFDGVQLSYDAVGDGPLVVLLHGFASQSFTNWVRPGVADDIADAGFRVVMLDMRGHGESGKPHEPSAYADGAMAKDVLALLDELDADACALVGYSMGAGVALRLLTEPSVRSAVLAGVGARLFETARDNAAIADALEAEDKTSIADPVARSFRDFADVTRADKAALAAIQRAPRVPPPEDLSDVRIPVLVLTADDDPLAGPPAGLAERIPGARVETVPGTHLNVVNHPSFRRAIVDFLTSTR